MDIKQLKFLIALDETRHFGQAAARCHITQPTLSMRLRSLEEELDLPLVNRGQRFEGFTAPGERVLAWARTVELALGDIANAPDPADDKLERFLTAWAKAQREALDRDPPIYATFTSLWEARRDTIMAHRARIRAFLAAIVDEGLEPGPFRIRDEERAVAFVADAMQRFVHPVLVAETKDLSRHQVEQRLGLVTRVIVRTLVSGIV